MDAQENRDAYELFTERHRAGSMIVTSNRGPDEWLATFADPVRAQSAVDRFTSNSYDLVIEGEFHRWDPSEDLFVSGDTYVEHDRCVHAEQRPSLVAVEKEPRPNQFLGHSAPILRSV